MIRLSFAILVLMVFFTIAHRAEWIPRDATEFTKQTIHKAVNPGALSSGHANLINNCNACHSPIIGVDPIKCILCHANNESILQRQPTAFHASVTTCKECHSEHMGYDAKLSVMDHSALSRLGFKTLIKSNPESEEYTAYLRLSEIFKTGVIPHSQISLDESILDCSACHSNDDRHQGLFGLDCAQCHATDRWTIAEYQHPSPSSNSCSQCHKAPPSHYMKHFNMISARVAGKPNARVDQCEQCHQTTSWNDIKRVGRYKHH